MALREYKCESCGLLEEVLLTTSEEPPKERPCKRCGKPSRFKEYSSFGLVRSSFQESPIDIKVGADAENRWQVYHDRQEERNRIRSQTGSLGLSKTEEGYVPISEETKASREKVEQARSHGCPPDPEMIKFS